MDAFLADFFGILTHGLIHSYIRDGSRHLDRYRASFYNDALLDMGVRRSFKEREVDSEPLAQWEKGSEVALYRKVRLNSGQYLKW
jgi:hypothetical protein